MVHASTRHEQAGLTNQQALDIYEYMLLARKVDERLWKLNRAGKIPFVVSGQGHEAAQVATALALNKDKDYVFPYYRDTGIVLSYGMTVKEFMLSMFAKAEDPNSGGRQMPGHFGQKKNKLVTGSSPVTTQVPHAAGIALAGKLKKENFVTYVSFGEGSSNQGDFHEGINFASVHKLPVIFMCQNNNYAISVPSEKRYACEKISDRAIGYGIYGITIDGMDPISVYETVKDARKRCENGEGPVLIEVLVERLTPHSSDDNELEYRLKKEVEEGKSRDPLLTYKNYLQETNLLTDEVENQLHHKIDEMIDDATDYAENAPFPDPEDTLKFVYGNK